MSTAFPLWLRQCRFGCWDEYGIGTGKGVSGGAASLLDLRIS